MRFMRSLSTMFGRRKISAKAYSTKRITKNICVISLTFFLTFVAYNGLANLQSSIHIQQGMGVINLSLTYAAMVVGSFVTPRLAIRKLGHKWTMAVSILGYILWMLANAYAVWVTMIPASILVGVAAMPLWTAKGAYFTDISRLYAALSGETLDAAVSKFFGIFFFSMFCNGILGSVISSTVLKPRHVNATESRPSEEVLAFCGINDCPGYNISNNVNLNKPEDYLLWLLVGIYAVTAFVGILTLVLFMDPMPEDLEEVIYELKMKENNETADVQVSDTEEVHVKSSHSTEGVWDVFVATVRLLMQPEMAFLIPFFIFVGLWATFDSADFPKSYISCSLGIWLVGVVEVPRSVCASVMCLVCGFVVKYTGRIPIMAFGTAIQLSLCIMLGVWLPRLDTLATAFTFTALAGVCHSIWATQLNAYLGVTFQDKPDLAFSCIGMWTSCAKVVAFGYSSLLCTAIKLYVTVGFLLLGIVGYGIAEVVARRSTSKDGEGDSNQEGYNLIRYPDGEDSHTHSDGFDMADTNFIDLDIGNGSNTTSGELDVTNAKSDN